MSTATAAPLLALLKENDDNVKSYALQSINGVVDELWSEISNGITEIEALYDDGTSPDRLMAALIASKIYYNLAEYESAVKFALLAEDRFDIDEKSQYVETIVSHSIEMYIKKSTEAYESNNSSQRGEVDPKLKNIFERMIKKCVVATEYKLALGIALEAYRLDLVNDILESRIANDTESNAIKLINYVLTATTTVIIHSRFRETILKSLFEMLTSMKSPDYFTISKVVVNLNDAKLAVQLFEKLNTHDNLEISYQIAFDLVSAGSQELLDGLVSDLTAKNYDVKLLEILSGLPSCDFYNTFLLNNKNIDTGLLNKSKSSLDGKFSLFHTAVSVSNGFMHAGTTDNTFIRTNLTWLGKAQNWAKFTATASLGVIHRGNLSDGKKVMAPYLPGSRSTSRYIKGGSLYGLGLIYAGFGRDITDYLQSHIVENSAATGDEDVDVLLHGACLGVGLAAMGSASSDIYECLKEVLYNDSAVSGEAAAMGMGLTMLGTGNDSATHDMFTYANETKHGNITRGLAIGLALVNYGRQDLADMLISDMLANDDKLLRYGGAFTIALAYVGTGNNKAVKKLLHIAVSDSNDDVRRAAVIALGFVLIRDYTTVPRIVELLSKSHNAHVRCGTAFALGIACAGKALPSAIEVLEPLTKDPVDFVRQAAMIALAMTLIQQTEKLNSKVKEVNQNFLNVVTNKHQEGLAKFGACIAQGIMNAGGRNVTIHLGNPDMGTLDTKAIVGLAMFSQFWYWFPLAHFLSLSFTPTTVIGVRGSDLNIPKFELNCPAKDIFGYPKMYEEAADKEVEKVATAVLSTTARAKARGKKSKKEKDSSVSEKSKTLAEPQAVDQDSGKEKEDDENKSKYVAKSFKVKNMSRVLPQQARYLSFNKDDRFTPIRKYKGTMGVIILSDKKPTEPIEIIETVRQSKEISAPLPTPFIVKDVLDYEEL
ncbi:hypothetical protein HG535_0E03280 [Zygotorulaspora mrakii]|uniref:26S proteasome regulatory subunit RPN2 n=1 Tax=Zygotorulaspora mrakii TaxID=42260 RepID=A0A7H9B4F0_ZYGMR|nr:uncharacterized protein HG535_0E03280 [Zygotorulaspora mrakii]QLG73244.1 hypothetical protein HG535_0E03280 [Zygotorulaspora mrakii]